jgi:hypothetical protein
VDKLPPQPPGVARQPLAVGAASPSFLVTVDDGQKRHARTVPQLPSVCCPKPNQPALPTALLLVTMR